MPSKRATSQQDYLPNQKVKLLSGGNAYFGLLLKLIGQAQRIIHLQVYIYEQDETGQLVADALIAAAQRGVSVYVLVDGYGSQGLKQPFIQQLECNGVHFRFFEPLLRSKDFYIGRRMHQKVLVVDACYGLVTGANIGDRYNDKPGQSAWLDFGVCVDGEIAQKLCDLCWMTWRNFKRIKHEPPCDPYLTDIDFDYDGICAVRMRRNDWVRRKNEISVTYGQLLRKAKKRVIMLSSYFLPNGKVRKGILSAARRGVKVQLIICSQMDVPLVKDAERFMYSWLLRHGVEIYEYSSNMLHGKLATCDDQWMTIGSFNVNDLSAKVSVELNLDIHGDEFVKHTNRKLQMIMQENCVRVSPQQFSVKNGWLNKLQQWFAFTSLRAIFLVGTFYMRQDARDR